MITPRPTVRGKAGESTRRMQATRAATTLAVLLFVWLALFLYGANVKRIMALGLPATLLIGGIFVFALKQLEKKGNVAIDHAKRAERGAVAEEQTGNLLDGLPEGHFIIHDFDTGRGNIDHILVGPKGIFTLEVKSHRGDVTFDGTILRRDGLPFEKDFLKQAWAECFAVREILSRWDIKEPSAEPVILFTNAYVRVRGNAKGVEVMNLKFLPKYMERLPGRLTVGESGRIFNRLQAPKRQ